MRNDDKCMGILGSILIQTVYTDPILAGDDEVCGANAWKMIGGNIDRRTSEDDWREYRPAYAIEDCTLVARAVSNVDKSTVKDRDLPRYLHEMNMGTGTTHFITGPCDMTSADLLGRDSATGLSRKHTGEIFSDIANHSRLT